MSEGTIYKNYPVLFVDDEKGAVVGFSRHFSRDFTVYTAMNGQEGLQAIQQHPEIAVILSDQRMPGMTGIDMLRMAREMAPTSIRMLLTAYSDIDVVVEAINKGNVYQYVTKPYNDVDLRYSIIQAIEYYRVVAERDRLCAEKIETLKKMARLNRLSSIGILAAGMAHEINNPLVAVSTFLQMLPEKKKEPRDDEYWNEFYGVATTEIKRIRDLIAQLLNYSKDTQSAQIYAKEADFSNEADLNRIIQEVVIFLKSEVKQKEIRFEVILEPNLPRTVMDEEKIRQLLINLTLNAIQATTSGKITLRTSFNVDQKYVEFDVSDTGVGISDQNLEQLFSPFFTTKSPKGGTGLGLMTCHHIVDEHRGNIDVRSKLGVGTTVTVQLPIDPRDHDRRRSNRRI